MFLGILTLILDRQQGLNYVESLGGETPSRIINCFKRESGELVSYYCFKLFASQLKKSALVAMD